MKHYFFCTYFDRNYCDKGLALYESLVKHVPDFTLYILCLDEETYYTLKGLNLSSIKLIRLFELEEREPLFFATRKNRSLIEYYFTSTPVFIRNLMTFYPEIDIISYIDADMYLFSSIDPAYKEMGNASIFIVEHRFPPELEDRLIYGRFNVGYLSFRNDDEGRRCLDDWSRDCIAWCYDLVEGDKFADQKYLDKWENEYNGLCVSKNIGINTAPWNVSQYNIELREEQFLVNGTPLLIYHFHGLKPDIVHKNLYCFDNHLREYFRSSGSEQHELFKLYSQYGLSLINSQEYALQNNHFKVIGKDIRYNTDINKKIGAILLFEVIDEIKKIRRDKCISDMIIILKVYKRSKKPVNLTKINKFIKRFFFKEGYQKDDN